MATPATKDYFLTGAPSLLSRSRRVSGLSLSRGIRAAEAMWADGIRDADALRDRVQQEIAAEPIANIDYVSVADPRSLEELHGRIDAPALLSLAVRFGATRLIDNALLEP